MTNPREEPNITVAIKSNGKIMSKIDAHKIGQKIQRHGKSKQMQITVKMRPRMKSPMAFFEILQLSLLPD